MEIRLTVSIALIILSPLIVPAVSAETTVIPCEGDFAPRGILEWGISTYSGETDT